MIRHGDKVNRRRSAKQRGKGRPVEGDQVVGREALIGVTIDLLRRLPPARVTRSAVAAAAGVHATLIGYYFGTRDKMLLAAVERLAAEATGDAIPDSRSASMQLIGYFRAQLRFTGSIPYMHRLMLEDLANAPSAEARKAFAEFNRRAVARYREMVADGARNGELVPDVDPLLLHIAVLGLTDFFMSAGPIIAAVRGKETTIDDLRESYGAFIERLLLNGLASPAPGGRASGAKGGG